MNTYVNTVVTARGCGAARDRGAAYAECGLSPWGKPAEHFLVDPTVHIDLQKFGLTPVNQVLTYDPDEIPHVIDVVGSGPYPNPTDWFEEVRRFGMSQKITLGAEDRSRLRPGSHWLVAHARAFVLGAERTSMQRPEFHGAYKWAFCPKNKHSEMMADKCCAGSLWNTVISGNLVTENIVERVMPSFTYRATLAGGEYVYHYAIFARFPIRRIAVIADPVDGTHEKTLKGYEGCPIPVELVEA